MGFSSLGAALFRVRKEQPQEKKSPFTFWHWLVPDVGTIFLKGSWATPRDVTRKLITISTKVLRIRVLSILQNWWSCWHQGSEIYTAAEAESKGKLRVAWLDGGWFRRGAWSTHTESMRMPLNGLLRLSYRWWYWHHKPYTGPTKSSIQIVGFFAAPSWTAHSSRSCWSNDPNRTL